MPAIQLNPHHRPRIHPSLSKNKTEYNYHRHPGALISFKGLVVAYVSKARLELHLGDQRKRSGAAMASDLCVKL